MATAADAAASHRALDAPILAIEGARTHAPAISTGVAAVSPAFFVQVASDRAPGAVAGSAGHHSRSFCRFCMCNVLLTFIMLPFWRAWLTSCRRLARAAATASPSSPASCTPAVVQASSRISSASSARPQQATPDIGALARPGLAASAEGG